MKVLGVIGLGNTGSMALIDLLREYDEISFDKYLGEFSFLYLPDGLADLEEHIVTHPYRFQSSDIAIKRFLELSDWAFPRRRGEYFKYNSQLLKITHDFIDSITQISWKGTWSFRLHGKSAMWTFVQKVLWKFKHYFGGPFEDIYNRFVFEPMRYSVRPDDFDKKARKYLEDMILATAPNPQKINLIDMAFPGDNPESCFHFFEDPCAIVVDRDPRDLYILSKCFVHTESLWVPTDNVDDFILYYRNMREKSNAVQNPDKVLKIQYEDLIYNYESTKKVVEKFLHIDKHIMPEKYFKPSESINNTQLSELFPEYSDDIKRIEAQLSDWIYDYSKYGKIEHKKKAW